MNLPNLYFAMKTLLLALMCLLFGCIAITDTDSPVTKFQNYPNPFEPSVGTVIEYTLNKGATVELKVVDILGRGVFLVNNEIQTAGTYKYKCTVTTSGTYLAVLTASGAQETIRMIATK